MDLPRLPRLQRKPSINRKEGNETFSSFNEEEKHSKSFKTFVSDIFDWIFSLLYTVLTFICTIIHYSWTGFIYLINIILFLIVLEFVVCYFVGIVAAIIIFVIYVYVNTNNTIDTSTN